MHKISVLIFCLFIISANLVAQHTELSQTQIDSLYKVGLDQIQANNFDEAIATLNNVIDADANHVPARMQLGSLYFRQGNISLAEREFKLALDIDEKLPEVYNSLGMIYFLIDREKWRAVEYFQNALKYRQNYPAAYYNLGLAWMAIGGEHGLTNAIHSLNKAISLDPSYFDAYHQLERIYQELGDAENVKAVRGKLTAYAEQAGLDVEDILAGFTDEKRKVSAKEKYLSMVAELTDQTNPDTLYADIVDITTDQEKKRWKKLETEDEKWQYLVKFWISRDPTLTTAENERLIEHYDRLKFARENFRAHNKKGYDERGYIYVRHGPPSQRIRTAPESLNRGILGGNTESWMYENVYPSRIFHFGESGAGNFVLVPSLLFAPRPNSTLPLYIKPSDLEELAVSPDLYFSRAELDPRYSRIGNQIHLFIGPMASPVGDVIRSDQERLHELLIDEESAVQRDMAWAKQNVTFEFSYDAIPFDFPYYTADFKDSADKSRLEVYYGVPVSELTFLEGSAEFESNLVVLDAEWERVAGTNDSREVMQSTVPTDVSSAILTEIKTFSLTPGRYNFAIDMEEKNANKKGIYQDEIIVKPYDSSELMMSDIVIAARVTPAKDDNKYVKHGLDVRPLPSRVFLNKQPVYVYYEIYNLRPDENGMTSYRVDYTLATSDNPNVASKILRTLGKLIGIKEDSGKLTVSYEAQGRAEEGIRPEDIAIDITETQPGRYQLVVGITDLIGDMKVVKSSNFKIQASSVQ